MTQPTYTGVLLYARFSHGRQKKGTSIQRQIEEGTEELARFGIAPDLIRTVKDEGKSGYHGHHRTNGELGLLEAQIAQGEFMNWLFYCEKVDRLSREGRDEGMDLIKKFITHGVSVRTKDGDCVAAMTNGLALEKADEQTERIAFGLATLCGRTDETEASVTFLLNRASLFRLFRSPCLADLGEHVRLLALKGVGRLDQKGDDLCDYIQAPEREDAGRVIEPREKFGEEFLVAAQFEAEGQLLDLYVRRLDTMPVKLFG